MKYPAHIQQTIDEATEAASFVYQKARVFLLPQLRSLKEQKVSEYVFAHASIGWRAWAVMESLKDLRNPVTYSVVCSAARTMLELNWDQKYLTQQKNNAGEVARYREFGILIPHFRYDYHVRVRDEEIRKNKNDREKDPSIPLLTPELDPNAVEYARDKEGFDKNEALKMKLYPTETKEQEAERKRLKKPARNNKHNWTGYQIVDLAAVVGESKTHGTAYKLFSLMVHGGSAGTVGGTAESVLNLFVGAQFIGLMHFAHIAKDLLLETELSNSKSPAPIVWDNIEVELAQRSLHIQKIEKPATPTPDSALAREPAPEF